MAIRGPERDAEYNFDDPAVIEVTEYIASLKPGIAWTALQDRSLVLAENFRIRDGFTLPADPRLAVIDYESLNLQTAEDRVMQNMQNIEYRAAWGDFTTIRDAAVAQSSNPQQTRETIDAMLAYNVAYMEK